MNVFTPISSTTNVNPSLCGVGVCRKAIKLDLPKEIFDLVRNIKFPDPVKTVYPIRRRVII